MDFPPVFTKEVTLHVISNSMFSFVLLSFSPFSSPPLPPTSFQILPTWSMTCPSKTSLSAVVLVASPISTLEGSFVHASSLGANSVIAGTSVNQVRQKTQMETMAQQQSKKKKLKKKSINLAMGLFQHRSVLHRKLRALAYHRCLTFINDAQCKLCN